MYNSDNKGERRMNYDNFNKPKNRRKEKAPRNDRVDRKSGTVKGLTSTASRIIGIQ